VSDFECTDLGFVQILDKEECARAVDAVNKCSDAWLPRGDNIGDDHFFYTLGAVSYIDCRKSRDYYVDNMKKYNEIMHKNFSWMYDIILRKMEKIIGYSKISKHLAPPGFHIFSPLPGSLLSQKAESYLKKTRAPIHVDIQHRSHNSVWDKYKSVDMKNVLSFTIPVSLPEYGGGLRIWDKIDPNIYPSLKINEKQKDPPLTVKYSAGEAFFHKGRLMHQILNSGEAGPEYKRITVQGHGVKCDDVWQLYF